MGIAFDVARAAARTPRTTPYRQAIAKQQEQANAQARAQHARLVAAQQARAVKRAEVATRKNQTQMPTLDEILTHIKNGWFRRHLAVPEVALDLATLWSQHNHYRHPTEEGGPGHLAFNVTPRLAVLAPGNGYGKTTYAELCGEISPNYFGTDQEPTEYGLIDALADEHATVILDEAGLLLDSRKKAVLSVLLAYTAAATKKTGRNGGTRKSLFGPIAFAATGDMATTTGDRFNALFDRSLVVHMAKGIPPHDPDTRSPKEAEIARNAMGYFAQQTFEKVLERAAAEDLPVPGNLQGRGKQIVRPLIAIGEAAGGEWLERAQNVAMYFRGSRAAGTPEQTSQLATSFRTAFMSED